MTHSHIYKKKIVKFQRRKSAGTKSVDKSEITVFECGQIQQKRPKRCYQQKQQTEKRDVGKRTREKEREKGATNANNFEIFHLWSAKYPNKVVYIFRF